MARSIAVFGGSFNPPHRRHRTAVEAVARQLRFDELVVVPCGPRPDKLTTSDIEPMHRAAMCDMAFRGIPGVRTDMFDLEQATFTRLSALQERYAADGCDVWHVVGTDLTQGGSRGESEIQRLWSRGPELWGRLQFVVVPRPGYPLVRADLPPRHAVVAVSAEDIGDGAASTDVRRLVFDREPYDHLVSPEVHGYVERYGLYRGVTVHKTTALRITDPKALLVVDRRNPKAVAIAERYKPFASAAAHANCIVAVGGDGHMLRTVRKHWHKRLPFVGVNAGHVGYLLNDESIFAGDLAALLGDLRVHLLAQLAVEAEDVQGRVCHHYAFNDAWVRDRGQAAWVDVTVDEETYRLIGDGVLVSTAAGSTGYAWSMGAHPLNVGDQLVQLVGNNLQSPRGWKCMQLPFSAAVTMTADGGKKRRVNGFVDGVPLGMVRRMRCQSSRTASVELAFSPRRDLTAKLREEVAPLRRSRRP